MCDGMKKTEAGFYISGESADACVWCYSRYHCWSLEFFNWRYHGSATSYWRYRLYAANDNNLCCLLLLSTLLCIRCG
jgi:hypothetical protein